MFYRINVAKDGEHYFATAARSLSTKWRAEELVKTFIQKFPESDGFEISISRHEGAYSRFSVEEFLAEDKED